MDQKLLEIFAEEAGELMEALEAGLLSLEGGAGQDLINGVFRAAHTMKGNAGIVGFEDVVELTHLMESLLDQMRQGLRQPDVQSVSLLLKATDALREMVGARVAGQEASQAPGEIMQPLNALLRPDSQEETAAPSPATPNLSHRPSPPANARRRLHLSIRLQPDLLGTGTDPLRLLRELEELGDIERVICHVEDLPPMEQMDPFTLYLWWEVWMATPHPQATIDNVFMFVRDEGHIFSEEAQGPPPNDNAALSLLPRTRHDPPSPVPAPGEQTPAPKAAAPRTAPLATPTIRVDTDKLDKLVNLVGELVIGVARVSESASPEAGPELREAMESLGHASRELQQQVMRVRMVPVGGTFNRFRRVVRDLAAELGKQIRLNLSGLDTELDKNVAEQIADPLSHLVRNAAVHGLETPAVRRQAGKPAEGVIWLRAYQQQGRIFIEVADDGRGIDPERVLARAASLGLTPPEDASNSADIYKLLFHPGFSTADKVTELSGRGVGLDVVRENIESLRGAVEVESHPGQGSTFRIKLPLTLAIIDGMNVMVAGEVFVLPLLSIVESLRPVPGDLKTVEGKGELIRFRGNYLPLVRLARLFRLTGGVEDPCQGLVMVIESLGKRFGLLVDDILGERQAVIKSLEQNYQKVPGVNGATILGDGRVSLILDILGLERMALGTDQE
ncbi:MAG: chemotaxis protein CheA [Proteobacteria bacterium]|nr:chemotaxis protein CheA [Pseudomonadota bacterium]MBU1450963.1 chemotaxis protein CheA [Pseudomonadota bacterium]MBU2470444.1 chemotaxis protein CheA [Pseudomonadota bacterium]MBU2517440.1 chemotaxis protein CheA [Pseudomonadota bacterium]